MVTDDRAWVRHDAAPIHWEGMFVWRFLPGISSQPEASIYGGPSEPIAPNTLLQVAAPPLGWDKAAS